jgi:hypothetical protein
VSDAAEYIMGAFMAGLSLKLIADFLREALGI